ncbi:hypothetical protein IBX65_08760, partial [Candidatus Aerophobetes bacterium]|nr:hypothetical protein [Candidatus Aerophobetes bacterium]
VRAHLAGDLTCGLYVMRADNTVKFMVIDIDVNKNEMVKCTQDEKIKAELTLKIQKDAKAIKSLAGELNIPAYIEDSGYKGKHIWFFFLEPLKASEVRNLVKALVKRVGEVPEGIHREIFPKQDKVARDALGSLIKLPLGIHKATGRRSFFVDSQGKPYGNQILFLQDIKQITEKQVREVIINLQRGFRGGEFRKVEDAKIKKIVQGCRVIKFLVNKAKEKSHLTHFERLVLLYSLGHLGDEGKQYLHQVMSDCFNYDFNYTQRWIHRLRVNAHPISCPKIRDWLSDITPVVGCYCEFDLSEGVYPSPLLFVNPRATSRDVLNERKESHEEENFIPETTPDKEVAVTESSSPLEKSWENLIEPFPKREKLSFPEDIDALVNEYVELRNSRKALDEKFQQCKAKLSALFDKKSTDSLSCRLGTLKRIHEDEDTLWQIDL